MKSNLQSYLRENARHGTADFSAGFYLCAVPYDFQDLPTHWHEEMEFTLVTEGRLHYTIGTHSVDASAGDLLLIAPDTLHSAHRIGEEEAETRSIVFHLKLAGLDAGDSCAKRFVKPLQEGQVGLPPAVRKGDEGYQELLDCFQRLWSCGEVSRRYRELLFKMDALRLVQLAWQVSKSMNVPPVTHSRSPYEEKLKLALAYMQEHYAETITVGQLAELCGFSEVHFMNVFKSVIGSTCMEYLIEYRLALAAISLRETDRSIMQIAMDSGFQNISYFNRTFKKKYHYTPSAYRKQTL